MDSYELLGLERGATEEDVDAAFARVKEMYYPDCSTELVPITEIDSERFLEFQNAYKSIKKEKKALAKISKVRPLEIRPESELEFTDVYGAGALVNRQDGLVSADDSQVSSFDAWTGMSQSDIYKGTGTEVGMPGEFGRSFAFGPGRTKASASLSETEINHSIEKFLDFSLFDLRAMGDEASLFYNAMTALQKHNPADAKRNLNRTSMNPPMWYYLMAITSYYEGDYVYARRNAVGAYTMETDNVHFWQLTKYLEGYEGIQREYEDINGPDIRVPGKTIALRVLVVVLMIIAAILVAKGIISVGKTVYGVGSDYKNDPNVENLDLGYLEEDNEEFTYL